MAEMPEVRALPNGRIKLLLKVRSEGGYGHLGTVGDDAMATVKNIIKFTAVFGIALGICTATEVTVVPFIFMGIGLLALSEVATW